MVYLHFENADGPPWRRHLVLGPYESVKLMDAKLFATGGGAPCYAVQDADGWHIHASPTPYLIAWPTLRFSDSPETDPTPPDAS